MPDDLCEFCGSKPTLFRSSSPIRWECGSKEITESKVDRLIRSDACRKLEEEINEPL